MKLKTKFVSGAGKQPPNPPVPPGPPTAPKPSPGAPGLLQQGAQGPKMPALEPETEARVPTILGPPSNGGILLPSMTTGAGEKVIFLEHNFLVEEDWRSR